MKIPARRTLRTYSAAGGGSSRNHCSAGNRDCRPGTASRIPAQPGLAGEVAVWAAQPARRAAFWEADRSRCSCKPPENGNASRSEEHTSELQSLMRISYAVFCLKKKTKKQLTT